MAFASLSLWGYTTKKETFLAGEASLIMGRDWSGCRRRSVNIFLASPALAFAISAIGVLNFCLVLPLYDTQNIKNTYLAHAHHGDQEWLQKSGIMGPELYLKTSFNMFMMLLQLFATAE